MSGINKAIIVGRVGSTPDRRSFSNGDRIVNFSVATSEKYKDRASGESKEVTDWHNITVRNNLADIAEKYVHKGDLIGVTGKMRTRYFKKDGIDRQVTEIIGDEIEFLTPKS